jgi:hypothetical protein
MHPFTQTIRSMLSSAPTSITSATVASFEKLTVTCIFATPLGDLGVLQGERNVLRPLCTTVSNTSLRLPMSLRGFLGQRIFSQHPSIIAGLSIAPPLIPRTSRISQCLRGTIDPSSSSMRRNKVHHSGVCLCKPSALTSTSDRFNADHEVVEAQLMTHN